MKEYLEPESQMIIGEIFIVMGFLAVWILTYLPGINWLGFAFPIIVIVLGLINSFMGAKNKKLLQSKTVL